jgi:hypothetical protein
LRKLEDATAAALEPATADALRGYGAAFADGGVGSPRYAAADARWRGAFAELVVRKRRPSSPGAQPQIARTRTVGK